MLIFKHSNTTRCKLTLSHANVFHFLCCLFHHHSFIHIFFFHLLILLLLLFLLFIFCFYLCCNLSPLHRRFTSCLSQVHDECDVGRQRLVVHRRRLPGEPKAGGHCAQQGQRVGEGRICCVSVIRNLRCDEVLFVLTNT